MQETSLQEGKTNATAVKVTNGLHVLHINVIFMLKVSAINQEQSSHTVPQLAAKRNWEIQKLFSSHAFYSELTG